MSVTLIAEVGNIGMLVIVIIILDKEVIPIPSVKNPEAGTNLVIGDGVSRNTIKVMDSFDNLIRTGIADTNVQIEFRLNQKVVLDDKVFVSVTDEAGNKSTSSETTVVDSVKAKAPKVNQMDNQMLKLVGDA